MSVLVPSSSEPPPPPTLIKDDPVAADAARKRFTQKSRLLSLPNLRGRRISFSNKPLRKENTVQATQDDPSTSEPITLDNTALNDSIQVKDRYEWAIVYENQRGMTIFSVPYYSSLSLLPTDPSPYTLPNASTKRSEQPPITLANYPLPDGNWQWISRSWMIDMGANTGAVQHDGFEYNWSFRNHAWRAQVGVLSAGGWVRRRRWVRLMMCPAKLHIKLGVSGLTPASSNDNVNASKHQSRGSSIPPSVNTGFSGSEINWDDLGLGSVWVGEDVGANWERCHHVLKKLGRDGRKLEVWRIWLGFYHPDHQDSFTEVNDEGKRRGKQWTEDESSEHTAQDGSFFKSIVPPSKEMIVGVIREHGSTVIHSFVYPESRAQFFKLLDLAGLLSDLNSYLGSGFGSSEVDFWSYTSGLGDIIRDKEILPSILPKSNH